jgi:hypothetical protein
MKSKTTTFNFFEEQQQKIKTLTEILESKKEFIEASNRALNNLNDEEKLAVILWKLDSSSNCSDFCEEIVHIPDWLLQVSDYAQNKAKYSLREGNVWSRNSHGRYLNFAKKILKHISLQQAINLIEETNYGIINLLQQEETNDENQIPF